MTIYDVIIVGGGISGLYTASLLSSKNPNPKIKVLEARDRLGGRLYSPNGHDMGGTWSWPHSDIHVTELAKQLNVSSFYDDRDQVRFLGGTQQLVTKLAEKLNNVGIELNHHVHSIRSCDSDANKGQLCVLKVTHVTTNNEKEYMAKAVVLAIPPRIILSKIKFNPPLPQNKIKAMSDTPTWMAGASKVFLEYSTPFWRSESKQPLPFGLSNGVMIYDASQEEHEMYAICAFHAGRPIQVNEEYVVHLLERLSLIFGNEIKEPNGIHYYNWLEDTWTCDGMQALKQRNRACMEDMHSFGTPFLREPVNSIYFASTETEMEYGHIEGALKSGKRVVSQLL